MNCCFNEYILDIAISNKSINKYLLKTCSMHKKSIMIITPFLIQEQSGAHATIISMHNSCGAEAPAEL